MIIKRFPVRRAAAVAVLPAVLVLGTAACGGDGTADHHPAASASGHPATPPASSPAAAGQHNDQDVAFAQGMIPHHRQAVTMADLAPGRAGSQAVKDLAVQIKKAQDPEITTMSGWLTAWGEEVPAEDMPGMDHGADHGAGEHGGMPGMMSEADMTELAGLSGAAFDTRFLEMMIAHHQGAVTMATTEKEQGAYAPAKDLAAAIITGQSTEIDQMKKLLGE
ncbi:DUF305 domain-containing protein [Actinocorallia populi]|uniref:DUF305 domain-containing protein n=1 Tax=Actinocorallia populi TaxID=2079200 RepID=UPI000D091036|nr:DUF305 domain-containing protein [Actinocorallia populi]